MPTLPTGGGERATACKSHVASRASWNAEELARVEQRVAEPGQRPPRRFIRLTFRVRLGMKRRFLVEELAAPGDFVFFRRSAEHGLECRDNLLVGRLRLL